MNLNPVRALKSGNECYITVGRAAYGIFAVRIGFAGEPSPEDEAEAKAAVDAMLRENGIRAVPVERNDALMS